MAIGKARLIAYSENKSSLAEILKLFITNVILNEIYHHTKAEGSSQISILWKDISSEELFAFLGLCTVSGVLRTRKEPAANLWTTNTAYARLIFCATMARDWFFQILCVICFDDKITRNQWRSTDKSVPIRDAFESIISRFQMAYTPNEHIITDKQLVVFRGKCLFCMFIKSKPGKYGIIPWAATDANNFYACNMQACTGNNGGVRAKKQGSQVVKDMVCHMYGSGRGITTDNFFTSCEIANFLLTKDRKVVGTLRKDKTEIPALFLVGKQRAVHSSIFGFTNGLTLVSNAQVKKQDCHPPFITASRQHMHGRGKRSQT